MSQTQGETTRPVMAGSLLYWGIHVALPDVPYNRNATALCVPLALFVKEDRGGIVCSHAGNDMAVRLTRPSLPPRSRPNATDKRPVPDAFNEANQISATPTSVAILLPQPNYPTTSLLCEIKFENCRTSSPASFMTICQPHRLQTMGQRLHPMVLATR